jgi:hypothetical protein
MVAVVVVSVSVQGFLVEEGHYFARKAERKGRCFGHWRQKKKQ